MTLIPYWFRSGHPRGPFGLGVTAYSLEDAYELLLQAGLEAYLHSPMLEVDEHIRVADLDPHHLAPNIGPIVTRGVWYPALNVGFGASGLRSSIVNGRVATFADDSGAPQPKPWSVWRQDDNGNRFELHRAWPEGMAQVLVRHYERLGHKQTYWAAQSIPHSSGDLAV